VDEKVTGFLILNFGSWSNSVWWWRIL
jgi:hypothetical protein